MNAENYVKAFQGIMGVYGLQFLLVPKKIVRFFYIVLLFVVFYRLFPPVKKKGNWVDNKSRQNWHHISLSLLTLTSTTISHAYEHMMNRALRSTKTTSTPRRTLLLSFFLVRIRFFVFVDW